MRKRLIKARLPTCAARGKGMSADKKARPLGMITQLVLTIAGALLMVGPPYVFVVLKLSSRFHRSRIAAIELASLVVGLVLLFFAFRGHKASESKA
jgi:Na+/H+ antiporter NhaD/arsenite permease-like protein